MSDGFKRKVDNKMRGFGNIDFDKKEIRINKKRSKKEGNGEILDTIVHEETHRKHPNMNERNIKKKTKGDIEKMSQKQKKKVSSKFNKKLSVGKAKEILRHGEIGGEPITGKQKRFFGFIAGGGTPTRLKPDRGFYHNVVSEVKPPK